MKKHHDYRIWLLSALLLLLLLLPACAAKEGSGAVDESADETESLEGLPLLTDLRIDGGYSFRFLSKKREYKITLPEGNPYLPRVSATGEKGATVTIEQAVMGTDEDSATATIRLEKEGVTNAYTVTFTKSSAVGWEFAYDDRYLFSAEGATAYVSSDESIVSVHASSGLAAVKQVSDKSVTITAEDADGKTIEKWKINRTVAASLDLFIVAGQSNAAGEGGDADTSAKPVEGTVYLSDSQGRSMISLSGGKSGFLTSFGKNWYEKSGRKVLFVQATATGRGVDAWAPGGEVYAELEKTMDLCIETLTNSSSYRLRTKACLFMQGEWDMASGTDAESYEKNLLLMRDALETRYDLAAFGILPVRSTRMQTSEDSIALGLFRDMLPVRAAQYALCLKEADMLLLTRLTETASPENGMMQDDHLTYTQEGYNRIGEDAAETLFRFLSPKEDKSISRFYLLTQNGQDPIESGSEMTLPIGTTYRFTPFCEPLYASPSDVRFYVSDERACTIDRYGLLTVSPTAEPQTVTLKAVCGEKSVDVTIRLEAVQKEEEKTVRPVEYGWRFDGNLEEKNGLNRLTPSDRSPDEGGYAFYDSSVLVKKDRLLDFVLEKPIRLSSSFAWSIQWRGNLYGDSCLLGQDYDTSGYVHLAPWNEALGHAIRFVTAEGSSFLIPYGEHADSNKDVCSWILSYSPENRMVSLRKNDTLVSEVVAPDFDVTFTNLFGRYGSENANINFAGELDWLKVNTYEG